MSKFSIFHFPFSIMILLASCSPIESSHVWLTSEVGDKFAEKEAVIFQKGTAENAIVVNLDERRQTIDGFGGSLTESSAFVLACLMPEQRQAILEELYGENGANFSVTRTQIGASDFSVEGKYSLAEEDGYIFFLLLFRRCGRSSLFLIFCGPRPRLSLFMYVLLHVNY